MSVSLHPDIETLDRQGLCYAVYSQLYQHFFNAQQPKDAEHPYGVEEGDATSIRLKNTAYGFASVIAGAVSLGDGTGAGGLLLEYLRRSGGDMTGMLRACYGFEAGAGNTRILETYALPAADSTGVPAATEYGLKITGNLRIEGEALHLGGQRLLHYDADSGTAILDVSRFDLSAAEVHSSGTWILGDRESGVLISPAGLRIGGKGVYHEGNANLPDIDWSMRNGSVQQDFTVKGTTSLGALLTAQYGVRLGDQGKTLLTVTGQEAMLSGFLSFLDGYGIRINGKDVLLRHDTSIRLGSIGGDLLLGGEHTPKVRLLSGIADVDGDVLLVSPYGHVRVPGSLEVRHDYGAPLLSSYRTDTSDEGIVVHKYLRFGTTDGVLMTGDRHQTALSSAVEYVTNGIRNTVTHTTRFSHAAATSHYQPQHRPSETFRIQTDADYITTSVPIEASGHLGIDGSATRLCQGILYFTEELRLHAVEGGIKHYGQAFFVGDLASEFFSSGFAGSGWAIQTNRTTGHVAATFDEIVVRRRFRAYEFEVMKISAANGSLWISNSCSGDSVEQIT